MSMSESDQARFEWWLEQSATEEERQEPYERQLELYILWLSGINGAEEVLQRVLQQEQKH